MQILCKIDFKKMEFFVFGGIDLKRLFDDILLGKMEKFCSASLGGRRTKTKFAKWSASLKTLRTTGTDHWLGHSWNTASRYGIHTWNRTWKNWRKCKEKPQK